MKFTISSPYTSTICGWEDVRFKFTNVDCTSWSLTSVELMDSEKYEFVQDTSQWGDTYTSSTTDESVVDVGELVVCDYDETFITKHIEIYTGYSTSASNGGFPDTLIIFLPDDYKTLPTKDLIFSVKGISGIFEKGTGSSDGSDAYSIKYTYIMAYPAIFKDNINVDDEEFCIIKKQISAGELSFSYDEDGVVDSATVVDGVSEGFLRICYNYEESSWDAIWGEDINSLYTGIYYESGEDVYKIYDADGLVAFNDIVSGTSYRDDSVYTNITDWTQNKSANAILMNDIDLSTVCSSSIGSWNPIGGSSSTYTGTFNGNSKNISNLYINGGAYSGLFGYTGAATIKDFTLYNPKITASGDISGGVAGRIGGATISGITVSGTDGYIKGVQNVGSIVGTCSSGSVINCSNYVSVEGTGTTTYKGVGGIVGILSSGTTSVEDCNNNGAVKGVNVVGGIVGYNSNTITRSNNFGDITGTGINIGGIVGTNNGNIYGSNPDYSWNTGTVSGASAVGGLIGLNSSSGYIEYYKTSQTPLWGTNNGSYDNCDYEEVIVSADFGLELGYTGVISNTGGTNTITLTLNSTTPDISSLEQLLVEGDGKWELVTSLSDTNFTESDISCDNDTGTIIYTIDISENTDTTSSSYRTCTFSAELIYDGESVSRQSIVMYQRPSNYYLSPSLNVTMYFEPLSSGVNDETKIDGENASTYAQYPFYYNSNLANCTFSASTNLSSDNQWITGIYLIEEKNDDFGGATIVEVVSGNILSDIGGNNSYASENTSGEYFILFTTDYNDTQSSRYADVTIEMTQSGGSSLSFTFNARQYSYLEDSITTSEGDDEYLVLQDALTDTTAYSTIPASGYDIEDYTEPVGYLRLSGSSKFIKISTSSDWIEGIYLSKDSNVVTDNILGEMYEIEDVFKEWMYDPITDVEYYYYEPALFPTASENNEGGTRNAVFDCQVYGLVEGVWYKSVYSFDVDQEG